MIISYELFAVYFCFIHRGPKYREITYSIAVIDTYFLT